MTPDGLSWFPLPRRDADVRAESAERTHSGVEVGDTLFLVIKTARHASRNEPVEIGELMIFAGPRFVVTVRHGEGSPLRDVRLDLEAHPDLLGIGPSSVL